MDCAKRGLGQKVSLVSDRTIKDNGMSIFYSDHNPGVTDSKAAQGSTNTDSTISHTTRLKVPF